MAYLGNPTKYQSAPYFEAVGNGSTTQYILSWTPGSTKAVSVSVGGIKQSASVFTVSGNKLTFSTAPINGALIIVHGFGVQGSIYSDTMIQYKYITTSGQTTISGLDYYGKSLDITSGYVMLYMNGVLLDQGVDYSVVENTIVLGSKALINSEIKVIAFGTFNAEVNNADTLDGLSSSEFATAAQGAKADSSVQKTGDETIAGVKTFSSTPTAPTAAVGTNSTAVATTNFVHESKKVHYWAGSSKAYNTAYLASRNIALSVLLNGSFMNGIDIAVGGTAGTITAVIGQFGDDINSNTKLASMWVLIPAGMYYQVRPRGDHAFETVVIIEYPFGE